MSKQTGIDKEIIQELWKSNGKVSSDFGTAIHNLLEKYYNGEEYDFNECYQAIVNAKKHFNRFKTVGKTIQKARGEKLNYALPSHPDIVKLITGEYSVSEYCMEILQGAIVMIESLGYGGESIQEPLLTKKDINAGGFADRVFIVDKKKKICRVQDYKVQKDPSVIDKRRYRYYDEMEDLERNVLSGHTIQLNFYALMLELDGWTVEGLDLFVRADEWMHFELELFDRKWFKDLVYSKLTETNK